MDAFLKRLEGWWNPEKIEFPPEPPFGPQLSDELKTWLSTEESARFRKAFEDSWYFSRQGISGSMPVHEFEAAGSHAAVFSLHDFPGIDSWQSDLLLMHFSEILKVSRYLAFHQNQKMQNGGYERIRYLKPVPDYDAQFPVNQEFGNVFLHVKGRNKRAEWIKIQVNFYSDRNYRQPKPFSELLDLLFSFGA
jgi:hypothetical protein